jgi:hypothetical protein
MRFLTSLTFITLLFCFFLCGFTALSQEKLDLGGRWEMEQVELLREGQPNQLLRGLIVEESDSQLEFAEVVRPAGKPMYVVIRPVEREQIVSLKRLSATAKTELADKLQRFRFQARFEAGAREDVTLHEAGKRFHYEGPWFSLQSSSDELSTRLIIVRLEQIFRAFRQILPPQREPSRTLMVQMHGSEQEYRAFLADQKLEVAAPAFFSTQKNLVSVACELSQCVERFELAQSQLIAAEKDLVRQEKHFRNRLQQTQQEMKDAGFSRDDLEAESAARQAAWNRERAATVAELIKARRGNESRFQAATQTIFRRLFHEGLHAYLANYIAADAAPLPAWVHEGLAQIFETGQLDGETLRIDAPDPQLLRDLQILLKTRKPAELLRPLVVRRQPWLSHDRDKSLSRGEEYIAAWGLCWYLLFDERWLNEARLRELGDADVSRWQGLPFESEADFQAFSQAWGKRMQSLNVVD